MTEKTDDLLPCPFEHPQECPACNHLVELHWIEDNVPRCIEGHECDCLASFDPTLTQHAESGLWSVMCMHHGTDGPIADTREAAITAWNTRAGGSK